ncbi:MAG TPA: hypothetical protein VIO38_08955 [Rariglobus sp.]
MRPEMTYQTDTLDAAAQAVTDVYAYRTTDGALSRQALTDLRTDAAGKVTIALRGGITPAQIAAKAGVRQLLVAQFIDDLAARADALRAARHDAERYQEQVMDALRAEVLAAVAGGTSKAEASRLYGVGRPAIDAWLRAAAEEYDVEIAGA